jgi:two-component system chemotaxis response regulator CheB
MTTSVLVVDDSPLIREILSRVLGRDGDIAVVGTAADPIEAREKIKALDPDVLTLDIEMPQMNGLAFLNKLMRLHPMPVVMVSTLTRRGADETLLALELGAVDFVAKPDATLSGGLEGFGALLRDKVRAAAGTALRGRDMQPAAPRLPAPLTSAPGPAGAVIAIGASTGGVDAIRAVLAALPPDCPPIVIAQHMPAGFTARFAARLDELCALDVVEAEHGMPLEAGHAYVARGDYHLRVEKGAGRLRCALAQDATASGHRPSVDVLFGSMAAKVGALGVGVILTGMGRDGAQGLKLMREAGAHTIGQTRESALVYGMPRVAHEEGAVCEQAPVEAVAGRIAQALQKLRAPA